MFDTVDPDLEACMDEDARRRGRGFKQEDVSVARVCSGGVLS